MKIVQKFSALFRGQLLDSAECLVDDNLATIIRQEVRDAEQALLLSRRQLSALLVEKKQLDRDLEHLSEGIHKKEEEACLLGQGDDFELVEAVAEHIAREEMYREQLQASRSDLAAQEARLSLFLQDCARELADYRRQLRVIEAQHGNDRRRVPSARQSMQLASALGNLKESIDRASEQHRIQQDSIDAENLVTTMVDEHGLQQLIDRKLGSELNQRTDVILERLGLAPRH